MTMLSCTDDNATMERAEIQTDDDIIIILGRIEELFLQPANHRIACALMDKIAKHAIKLMHEIEDMRGPAL